MGRLECSAPSAWSTATVNRASQASPGTVAGQHNARRRRLRSPPDYASLLQRELVNGVARDEAREALDMAKSAQQIDAAARDPDFVGQGDELQGIDGDSQGWRFGDLNMGSEQELLEIVR